MNTPPGTIKRQINYNEDPFCEVYRPAAQVFDKASLGSFAHKPVTDRS
ncbi:DUF2213 domain-containing protein [Sinorhizobium meliloti]|nr:DUF2213 domain-containing protein [Sinorhizobium meliloti]